MKYPKEVPVLEPGQVGAWTLAIEDDQPNCALGWRNHLLMGDVNADLDNGDQFCKAYIRCANQLRGPVDNRTVASTNNYAGAEDRALLVNAAFAALGYVVGQQPEAVKLARKAGFKV